MQEEVVSLKQQKVKAEEKVIDERARADHLDKQKQTLSSNNEALLNNEVSLFQRTSFPLSNHLSTTQKTLRKELDNQRISLKAYYQDQLEQVVAMKLNEFQKQLDTVEETLKIESKQRERLIAERAMKQMELINQK